ncbi:Flavinator of succinate dehydrogenase-domain-containing protein [Nemania serpens]|nr:Flavinator of succinate dehydrogenase-domain-containing protein [Nemania serpens]
MASFQRSVVGPARHALAFARSSTSKARAPRLVLGANVIATRSIATVGNAPPMEPQKQRARDIAVGELEGASFTIEPLRRVGEDDKTMRARLVYQSRKRGILETDLLLSTFADAHLPTMTREQMAEYDLFLDENDWDIYYWATQEEPESSTSSSSSSTTPTRTTATTASTNKSTTSTDTNSPSYGSGPETESATADPSIASSSASSPSPSSSTTTAPSTTSTGGLPLSGEHGDAKADIPTSTSTSTPPPSPYAGEWAQTVGTFKPAYRPVPARWRDSGILSLLRAHVRARAGERGGMAFMPALRS